MKESKQPYPPYLASAGWYAAWFGFRCAGADDAEAIAGANRSEHVSGRDLARCLLAGNADASVLSVPVEGGARPLRSFAPGHCPDAQISNHGNWRHVHLATLDARIGRMPCYPHIAPLVREAIFEESSSLCELNRKLHEDLVKVAGMDEMPDAMTETAQKRGNEIAHTLDRNATFLEVFSKIGREAVLALRAMSARVVTLIMAVVMVSGMMAGAADNKPHLSPFPDNPQLKVKAYKGFYRFVDEYGDTVRMTVFNDIYVYPPLKFKNKKQEEYYWRTVRDVKKTLPYAKMAFAALTETYEYIQTIPDKKAREKHLKQLEKDIVEQYKPVVKKMTKNQGKILLKLITRETDQDSYQIVKAFLGSLRASFYQAIGRLFGMNMKTGFNPQKNKEDAMIDRIATLVEQGAL